MSKPKIALLERDAKDWGPEEMLPLLRLARAAKGLIDNQQTHRPRCHDCAACDIRDAADAFDWGDE